MPDLDDEFLKELYHYMHLAREFDRKLFKLQRSGKIGTYAQVKGEEASEIGSAFALRDHDWFVPSFREASVYLVRGADRPSLVRAWNGDVRAYRDDQHPRNLPPSIPIASQLVHAMGIAWANKIKQNNEATIVYFGDGATSEGDFHEAMNFAGVHDLPIVFFCQNNQYAISTPREKQTRSETIAQKATAYGFEGVQVDGNDVIATYQVTKEKLDKARHGHGPTLIESLTYRVKDHTTSDDSGRYRDEGEVEEWKKKGPLLRLQKYFENNGLWTNEYKEWVQNEVKTEVSEAVKEALKIEEPGPENLFEHIFSEELPEYKEALQMIKEEQK